MIFDKFLQGKSEEYLAVNIFPKSCNLATFVIDDGTLHVTNSTFYDFAEGETLTDVIHQFLQKQQVRGAKIVFGLPSVWIDGEQVKPEFERGLVKTTEDLKLTPMAFVSSLAALGFYKFRQNPNLESFYLLQFFDQKVLVEKFTSGEVVKSHVESFEEILSLNFSNILADEEFEQIFVYCAGEDFSQIQTGIEKFFKDLGKTPAKISEIRPEEFARSLATATAFDLGKLAHEPPAVQEEARINEEFGFIQEKDVREFAQAPQLGLEAEKPGKRKFLDRLPKFLPLSSFDITGLGRKKLLAAAGFFVVIIVLLVIFWFLPKASVELFVRSSIFTKDFDLKAAPTAATVDIETQTIPGKVLVNTKEGSKKAVTTGKKKIGEKAQGAVTVFNKTAAAKTFSSGIVIIGPSNTRFVLTESLVVASRSATLEGITFGKGKVKIEATEIGEPGNLPADTNFTFADFDSLQYSAHSDEAFAGGTSKEVNVVAAEDKKRLEDELIGEFAQAAKTELVQQAEGAKIEDGAIVAKPVQLQYDKEVGVEANILTLQAKVSFATTAFLASDVEKVITEKLKEELPEGFSTWQNTKIETAILKVADDGTLAIRAKFEADLIPEINQDEILAQILGKSPEAVKNYLLSIPDIENINIRISPRLPGFLGNLPRFKSRIKIEIKAQRENL